MKKIVLSLATLFILSKSFAGDISEKSNLFGLLGGFSVNTMNYKENSDDKKGAKVGGLFGFSFEHRFKNVAAIEIQALYVNKGAQSKTDNAIYKATNRLNFHSVELPVLAKFYLGKKKIFNINVGGYASYSFVTQLRIKGENKTTGAKIDEKLENISKSENNPKDINGHRAYNIYDAGIIGGFEFISQKGFGAGARLSQGFIDFTNPKFIFDDGKKIWHTGVQFYMTYKF